MSSPGDDLRRKVRALLVSGVDPDVLTDLVIDIVSTGLGRIGGRPRKRPPGTSPFSSGAETFTDQSEISIIVDEKGVSEPVVIPCVKGGRGDGLGSDSDLTLFPDSDRSLEIREDQRSIAGACPTGFSEFWAAYPKKVGKSDAARMWKRHRPPLGECLRTLAWQRVSHKWAVEGYVPNPATWINGGRWMDQPPEKLVSAEPVLSDVTKRNLAARDAWMARKEREDAEQRERRLNGRPGRSGGGVSGGARRGGAGELLASPTASRDPDD